MEERLADPRKMKGRRGEQESDAEGSNQLLSEANTRKYLQCDRELECSHEDGDVHGDHEKRDGVGRGADEKV